MIRVLRSFLSVLMEDKIRSFRLVKTGVTNLVPGELIPHLKVMKRITGSAIIT